MGKKERHYEQRAIDLEQRRLAKEAEREERRRAWHARHDAELEEIREERRVIREHRSEPGEDPFVVQMAARLGIAPAEFIELQQRRRAEMDRVNRKGSIADQLATLTPIDRQTH